MPNTSITDALKEVNALAPNDDQSLATFELSHPNLEERIFIVQDRVEWDFALEEGGEVQTFEPVPVRFNLPAVGSNGIQELNIAIDNIDRRITDFVDSIGQTSDPLEITHRIYLKSDTTKPQNDPPLVLFGSDLQVNQFEVIIRASFGDMVNKNAFTEIYDNATFPGLA